MQAATTFVRVDDVTVCEETRLERDKMETLGRLAGGIAHDFGNLTAAILINADSIMASMDGQHPFRLDVEAIRDAARRATALSRQLLAFSRRQALRPRVLNLNDVLRKTRGLLRCALRNAIETDISLSPDTYAVRVDPVQIEQVIMNLALNARDAMPRGGRLFIRTATLEVTANDAPPADGVPAGRYVALTIADTGVGMDAETLSRIFEPFFSTKAPGKGTGLGLATVYGIVKQSGGFITVSSLPGHGTTFRVLLPCLDPASVAAEPDDLVADQADLALA